MITMMIYVGNKYPFIEQPDSYDSNGLSVRLHARLFEFSRKYRNPEENSLHNTSPIFTF